MKVQQNNKNSLFHEQKNISKMFSIKVKVYCYRNGFQKNAKKSIKPLIRYTCLKKTGSAKFRVSLKFTANSYGPEKKGNESQRMDILYPI